MGQYDCRSVGVAVGLWRRVRRFNATTRLSPGVTPPGELHPVKGVYEISPGFVELLGSNDRQRELVPLLDNRPALVG